MMIRQDRYQVGDLVTFAEQDPYIGSDIPAEHKEKYGDGPYLVEAVEDVAPISTKGVGHTQWLTINGVQFSGAWFVPVRP